MSFGKIILESLAKRVIAYLGNDLQLNVQKTSQASTTDKIKFSNQTACISISGVAEATIALSTSYRLSELVLRNFINIDIFDNELHEFSQASLAETLNITLGNIIEELSNEYGTINISSPFFLENEQIISKNEKSEMYLIEIMIENERMILSYFI